MAQIGNNYVIERVICDEGLEAQGRQSPLTHSTRSRPSNTLLEALGLKREWREVERIVFREGRRFTSFVVLLKLCLDVRYRIYLGKYDICFYQVGPSLV